MSTSLQIKIATLLGYVILSTMVVVMPDDGAPSAGFSPSTPSQHQSVQ